MRYCPKCRTEYGNKKKICPKCGEKLVPEPKKRKNGYIDDKEEFLISVREGYEAEMVEGGLRSAGIPFFRKGHGGPQGFIRYDTKYESLGADFYVPSKLLERAKECLPPLDAEGEQEQTKGGGQAASASKAAPAPQVQPHSLKRTLIIVLFLVVMAVVVFSIDSVMNFIRSMMGYK